MSGKVSNFSDNANLARSASAILTDFTGDLVCIPQADPSGFRYFVSGLLHQQVLVLNRLRLCTPPYVIHTFPLSLSAGGRRAVLGLE